MTAAVIYAALGGKGNINRAWPIESDVKKATEPITVERINSIKNRYMPKIKKNAKG